MGDLDYRTTFLKALEGHEHWSEDKKMTFKDREDAGRQLAKRLSTYGNRKDVIVLGIPRGGVSVAFEIAQALAVEMDFFLSSKLGVPGEEEVAFGALADGDGRFLDTELIRRIGISERQIEQVTERVKQMLSRRAELYRGNRTPVRIKDRIAILVDDGIATGASIYTAINALEQMKPAKLVTAVPIAPAAICAWLRSIGDEFICLHEPADFYAVGQFYQRFSQVTDEEVVDLLRRAWRSSPSANSPVDSTRKGGNEEVLLDAGDAGLPWTLTVPNDAKGIV
jgi:putative phosphoribosyl transferase